MGDVRAKSPGGGKSPAKVIFQLTFVGDELVTQRSLIPLAEFKTITIVLRYLCQA